MVLNLSKELEKLGHELLIVQLRPDNDYPELTEGLNVIQTNSKVYYSTIGKDIIETKEFDQIVHQFKPEVIHSHLLDSEFVSRYRIVPDVVYITHWHGCPSLTQPIPFSQWFKKESIWKWNTLRILKDQYERSRTHFICISDFIGQYVQDRLGVQTSNISIIHNAIDLKLFQPQKLEKKEGFRLINIGSLHRNKNHQFLFKVVQQLLNQGLEDVYLDIYGDGPEKSQLLLEVEVMGLQNHVKLHGIVNDPEVQINQAHLMVHSAWHEPFGLIFIESMACGIPVVSFNTGGPAELINDGENGYLIEKDDLSGFVEKVKHFYNHREQLNVFGKRGIESSAKFGLEDYAKKIEAVCTKRLAEIRK